MCETLGRCHSANILIRPWVCSVLCFYVENHLSAPIRTSTSVSVSVLVQGMHTRTVPGSQHQIMDSINY
jgi:hypothetical protein